MQDHDSSNDALKSSEHTKTVKQNRTFMFFHRTNQEQKPGKEGEI